MASQLGIGEVAALINIGLVVLQATYPLLIAFITVGLLKTKTNVATWSVFGHLINESHWPLLLSTDTASRQKVDKRIWGMSWFSTLAAILLGVSAALTPLGLHTKLELSQPKDTIFTYVKDESPIGQGTPPRDEYDFNRFCTYGTCPGNPKSYDYVLNANTTSQLDRNPYVTNRISDNITAAFESVDSRATSRSDMLVAGIFDIQWRNYLKSSGVTKDVYYDAFANVTYTTGMTSYYQQFLPNSRIEAIEGLVVSTLSMPGIGFRNHTLPPESKYGYEWVEDLLWLEPETACTDLNITLDYTVANLGSVDGGGNARLTDRGGLQQLPETYPEIKLSDMQQDPQLLHRSWVGAVSTNKILAAFLDNKMNRTEDSREYYLRDIPTKYDPMISLNPNQVAFSTYGSTGPNVKKPQLPGPLAEFGADNAYGTVQVENNIRPYVWEGYPGWLDEGNVQDISKVALNGGLVMGIGRAVDENGDPHAQVDNFRYKPGTKYSHPVYSCVTAVKASVKTVHFRIKWAPILKNLVIDNILPSSRARAVWGVERTYRKILSLDPIWGFLDERKDQGPGMATLERDYLYLPAGYSTLALEKDTSGYDSMAGTTAPSIALNVIYDYSPGLDTGFQDYTGRINQGMLMRWAHLTQNASSVGRIYDLMWTEIMANFVLGTKGVMQSPSESFGTQQASQILEVVAYDWRYAILILTFSAFYLGLLLFSILLATTKRYNLSTLHFMLDQTAAGRSITTERFSGDLAIDYAKTKDWAQRRGDEIVYISNPDGQGTSRRRTAYRIVNQQSDNR